MSVFKNYGCMYSSWVISTLYISFMSQLQSGLLRNTILCICGHATHSKHSDGLPHWHLCFTSVVWPVFWWPWPWMWMLHIRNYYYY